MSEGLLAEIVYLAVSAPTVLAEQLTRSGHIVWEALSVSEVLYLCEHHTIDAVVIAPEVEDADVVEVQFRRVTITLERKATAADVIWELSQLFPPLQLPLQ